MTAKADPLQNPALERALLSAILRNPAVLGTAEVTRDLFYLDKHGRLFELLAERFAKGEATDPELLVAWVVEHGIESEIGPVADVFAMAEDNGRHLDPRAVVAQLRRFSTKRAALRSMKTATEALKDPQVDHEEALASLVETLSKRTAAGEALARMEDLAISTWQRETSRVESKTSRRMKTGIREFDEAFGGVSRRGCSLFIGASGMGKTTLANVIALSCASRGEKVVIHGTETTNEERTEDLLFSIARIDPDEWDGLVQNPQLDMFSQQRFDQLWSRLSYAGDVLSRLPIIVSSKRGGTVEALASRLRALRAAGLVTLVIADYIQDFAWTTEIAKGEITKQVGHVTTTLKDVGSDLDLPILEFAQRSDEKRGVTPATARPQMWDCQHSSRAHQDADEVFVMYRNDYYVETIKDWPRGFGTEGVVEVIRRKVRRGARRACELKWDGPSKWVGPPLQSFSPMTRVA